MMNSETYKSSLKKAELLLTDFGVLKEKKDSENKFSDELRKISKKKNIIEVHNYITSNSEYTFLLQDDSIFQFSFENGVLRYLFIQTPYKYIDINSYAELVYDIETLNDLIEEFSIVELHSMLKDEYEQFLDTQSVSSNFNYIRYDFSDIGYAPMLHSKSHLHIGTNQNLRIPISKFFTPLKFVSFCLKNTYYRQWKDFVNKKNDKSKFLLEIKNECRQLSKNDWVNDEENVFYLS